MGKLRRSYFKLLLIIISGFRYSGGPSAKSEVKTLDGITRGTYSYIDAESKLQTVNYVADALGFRVAATNLPTPPVDNNPAPVDTNEAPQPVEDTEEVKQAREEHLAAVEQAKNDSAYEPEAPVDDNEPPQPVEDTEEVKQAREEHLQAVEEAKVRNAMAPSDDVASPEIVQVAQPAAIQIAQPAAIHLAQPASVVHLTHAPLAVVRSNLGPSFAYSVVSSGHPQFIAL